MPSWDKPITIAARASPLSQAQVKEVLQEMQRLHPKLSFDSHFLQTTGDLDRHTSLRTLDKTDFFTKEIDDLLLSKVCRLGIHSAKDLPEPLPKGLMIAAITKGLDPKDALVIQRGESLSSLRRGAVIGTSSARREEAVKALRDDFTFIDLRGTIAERIAKVENGEADGVVIAECALVRLQLTDLNYLSIPGQTTPLQGQLAVVCREDDWEMIDLFKGIDVR